MRGRLPVNVASAWAAVAAAIPAVAADGVDAWPATSPEWLGRGSGGGIAILPLLLWWLVLLAWMRTTAWVREESRRLRLPADRWTAVCGLTTLAAALVAWWIPTAWVALPLVFLAWLVPVVVFTTARNPRVAEHDRVLTPKHARRLLARLLARFDVDISEDPGAAVPLVALAPAAAATASDTEADALRLKAAEVPGYEQARTFLLDAVMARAATLRFVPSERAFEPQHEVDGLWVKPKVRKPPPSRGEKETWVDAPVPPRDVTDAAIKALEALAGGPQGAFTLFVDGKPRPCKLKSAATRDQGPQTWVTMGRTPPVFKTTDDLGMPRATAEESKAGVERLADRLKKLLSLEKGMLIVSGPPKSGVTTTFDVVLLTADRLLRDFVSIEDEVSPAREIQNVKPVRYDSNTGGKPLEALATAMRDYPRGVVARDVRDPAFVAELARLADEGLFVIISIPAVDAADGIERLIKGGVEPALLARAVVGSLSQRLVRKLCPQCREEYTPTELEARFKQLPPDRRTGIRKPLGCALCAGIGYLGRTAAFELASGEEFREKMATTPSADALRTAAQAGGMQPLSIAVMDLVSSGVTSMEERQRVLAPSAAKKPATRPRPAT